MENATMDKYECTDGGGDVTVIAAESPENAARKFIDSGEWMKIIGGAVNRLKRETNWRSVRVTLVDDTGEKIGETEWISVEMSPNEAK